MRRLCMVLAALMIVYGCSEMEDTWDRWMGNDDDDEKTEVASAEPQKAEPEKEPEKLPTPKKDPEPKSEPKKSSSYSNYYHHYNPQAWHGGGVAIVLCPNAKKMDSCDINGRSMYLHGNKDRGRYVYTRRGETGTSGVISCTRGNKEYKYRVKGGRSIQYGSCG